MTEKSNLTAQDAMTLVGRHGKVNGSASFYYGQIIDVHPSGDYLLFQRSRRFKPKWYHRSDVFPHDPIPSGLTGTCEAHAPVAS